MSPPTTAATDLFRLDGKCAIVTGAAQGLGAATATLLASLGARVAAVDLDKQSIMETSFERGGGITAYAGDVSHVAAMGALVERVAAGFGRIDILVNNAAICPQLPFYESTEADWEKLMSVNAKSQYFLCQAVCRIMKNHGGGRIVNVASTGGRVGSFSNASIYCGTKGAIVMFTKSIAREVAADGILVNCIAPGPMDTGLMRHLPPDRLSAVTDQIPLRRLGQPEEVARLIAFMSSDAFSYATGATYDVNGGWVML